MEEEPARIVVLDAEPVVRRVIQGILERDGYDVTPVADAATALEIIRSAPPALVITNVYLPNISGHEAMRLIRESCPGVPVLMVSGLPDSDVIRDWRKEDGFDVFPKPFAKNQLSARVKQILAARTSARGSSSA